MAIRAHDLELHTLTVEQEDRVLTVRFSDPPYNYMTARMQKDLDTLTAAVDAARPADPPSPSGLSKHSRLGRRLRTQRGA